MTSWGRSRYLYLLLISSLQLGAQNIIEEELDSLTTGTKELLKYVINDNSASGFRISENAIFIVRLTLVRKDSIEISGLLLKNHLLGHLVPGVLNDTNNSVLHYDIIDSVKVFYLIKKAQYSSGISLKAYMRNKNEELYMDYYEARFNNYPTYNPAIYTKYLGHPTIYRSALFKFGN